MRFNNLSITITFETIVQNKYGIKNIPVLRVYNISMNKNIRTPKLSEILKEEYMEPYGISAYKLAKDINVPVSRIQDILHERRKITADTSLRLAKYFGLSDDYFLSLQNDIDLRNMRLMLTNELDRIICIKQI